MLSILCVGLTIKVKVEIPESFKVGWYPPKKTGSSHLNTTGIDEVFTFQFLQNVMILIFFPCIEFFFYFFPFLSSNRSKILG